VECLDLKSLTTSRSRCVKGYSRHNSEATGVESSIAHLSTFEKHRSCISLSRALRTGAQQKGDEACHGFVRPDHAAARSWKMEREYLEAAAYMHDLGYLISHSQHHRHSYYIIRNAELLGFTDREIEIIANVARYHRKVIQAKNTRCS